MISTSQCQSPMHREKQNDYVYDYNGHSRSTFMQVRDQFKLGANNILLNNILHNNTI